jgi:hypothetical protein
MFSHSQGSCTAARYTPGHAVPAADHRGDGRACSSSGASTTTPPFRTGLDRVLNAGSHLVASIRITLRSRTSEAATTVENHWLFEMGGGNFVRVQVYTDTAAGYRTAS